MAVSLTKIVDGTPAVSDTLENEQILQCALCDEVYRLPATWEERAGSSGPFQHGFQHGRGSITGIHRVIRTVIEYTEGASFVCRICTWSRSEALGDYAAAKLTR